MRWTVAWMLQSELVSIFKKCNELINESCFRQIAQVESSESDDKSVFECGLSDSMFLSVSVKVTMRITTTKKPVKKQWRLLLNVALCITRNKPGWCAAVVNCLICFLTAIYFEKKRENSRKMMAFWMCNGHAVSLKQKVQSAHSKALDYQALIWIDSQASL